MNMNRLFLQNKNIFLKNVIEFKCKNKIIKKIHKSHIFIITYYEFRNNFKHYKLLQIFNRFYE